MAEDLDISSLPDDVLIKIFALIAADRATDLLAVTRVSRRIRALARSPSLWESVVFHRDEPSKAYLALCASVGAHFRRFYLAGTSAPPAPDDAIRGLTQCRGLTHLSLMHWTGSSRLAAAPACAPPRPQSSRRPKIQQESSSLMHLTLPNLVHLNLCGTSVPVPFLRSLLDSCSSTLERLYLCATNPSTPRGGDDAFDPHVIDALPAYMPRLEQLDLSRTVCAQADIERVLAGSGVPALRDLFLVSPLNEPGHGCWDPAPLASRLKESRDLEVINKDFHHLIVMAVSPQRAEFREEKFREARELLPTVERCSGIDAVTSTGGTLFLDCMVRGQFAGARRLVEEFGASPLAVFRPMSCASAHDPWRAPYPHSFLYLGRARTFPAGSSVLHLTCSDQSDSANMYHMQFVQGSNGVLQMQIVHSQPPTMSENAAVAQELPSLLKEWGLAKLVNAPQWDGEGLTPLHVALLHWDAQSDDASLPLDPKALLDMGADPAIPDAKGRTPLHIAAQRFCTHSIELLLEVGADPAIQDSRGWTPLHIAAVEGHEHVMQRLLLGMGADLAIKDNKGRTVLHRAAQGGQASILKAVLEESPDLVDVPDSEGLTALHVFLRSMWYRDSFRCGSSASVLNSLHTLLNAGASTSATDAAGRTPLQCIAAGSRGPGDPDLGEEQHFDPKQYEDCSAESAEVLSQIVLALLKRADVDVNARDDRGRTPLHLAAQRKVVSAPKIVRALLKGGRGKIDLNAADDENRTPLYAACEAQCAASIAALLEAGADPSRTPPGLIPPLLVFAKTIGLPTGGPRVKAAGLAQIRKKIVSLFLQKSGASDLEAVDETGRSVLHYCALSKELKAVIPAITANPKLRLRLHTSFAIQTPSGRTPLMLAIEAGNDEAFSAFLPFSDPLAADAEGSTALNLAISTGRLSMMQSFLRRIKDFHPWPEDHARYQADLATARDPDGRTALHLLSAQSNASEYDATELLALSDAPLTLQDCRGQTPLHIAARRGREGGGARGDRPWAVLLRLLKQPKAKEALAVADNAGATPLHLAARWSEGDAGGVRALLEAGAPAAARDRAGRTASEVAPESVRKAIEEFNAKASIATPASAPAAPASAASAEEGQAATAGAAGDRAKRRRGTPAQLGESEGGEDPDPEDEEAPHAGGRGESEEAAADPTPAPAASTPNPRKKRKGKQPL
eukprot:tig00020553_g10744.t1